MLLIFPRIEISKDCCIDQVRSETPAAGIYTADPVQMAVLWRGENATTLHVVDKDRFFSGSSRLAELVGRMVKAVDIPIQVGGGLRTYEDVKLLLDAGVYRIVVGTVSFTDQKLLARLLRDFGSRKIAVSMEAINGTLVIEGRAKEAGVSILNHALKMKKMGVSRIIYTSFIEGTGEETLDLDALRFLAEKTGVRITATGGVQNYKDLLALQELEKVGVDSVIIGAPLYENRFPCQELWRINEQQLEDLGPTRRI